MRSGPRRSRPTGLASPIEAFHPPAREIGIRRLDGTPDGRIALPTSTHLAGPMAWSPDGRFLVGLATDTGFMSAVRLYAGDHQSYVFLDVSGATAPAFAPVPAKQLVPRAWGDTVIGWRSPTRMLVSSGDVDGTTRT